DRIRTQPNVVAAGAANMAPFVRATAISGFTIQGPDGEPRTVRALHYVVTPGYAEAVRLRLREGRFFEPRDVSGGVTPMLVNEEFVRSFLTDGRPVLGRQFSMGPNLPPREIVGVVGNVLKDGLDTRHQPEIYVL